MKSNRKFFKNLPVSKQRFFTKDGKQTEPKTVVWANNAEEYERLLKILDSEAIIGRLDLD